MKSGHGGSVNIEQRMDAPAEKVSGYISDFRNAREWMVGVESVEQLGEDTYRLALESPIGKVRPEVRIIEQGPESISWVYTSTIDGGGRMEVSPDAVGGCVVSYTGEFHLKRKLLDRAARLVGAEKLRPHQRRALPLALEIPDGSQALLMPAGLIEILLIFMVFLILGPRRIVDLFRSLGTGVHDFIETLGKGNDKAELPEKDDEHEPKS